MGLLNATSPDLIAVGGDESVNVAIRVRPFNRRELELHRQKHPEELIRSVVEMPDGVAGTVRLLQRDEKTGDHSELETFNFTKSFWSIPEEQQPSKYLPITQEDVYDCIGRVVLTNAFMGFNSCVFAYGQTGSGKTHTMMGDFTTQDGRFLGDPGIIPRLCKEMFDKALEKKAEAEKADPLVTLDFDFKLSAIEIYNEQVRDLFWKGSNFVGRKKDTILKIRLHPTEGHYVDQLTCLNPKTWEQCIKQIASGVSERTVAATLMNDESSRSHSVFQIIIQANETLRPPPDDPQRRFDKPAVTTRVSRINLVDLAGSERNKKSGAVGQQLKEAAGINQSLSTLKKVIDALVTNCTEKNPKKHVLVPYRESALTQLLSHSLGGNSKTTMIACVSPHHDNAEETLLTLRYANRTKGIVNHVKANEDNAQKQAMLLREQILALQRALQEGPQTYSPQQIEELREQLEAGQRDFERMQREQREREEEARRIQASLKTQQDARYAATYYNSFKRAWLLKQRSVCEQHLHELESKVTDTVAVKDRLSMTMSQRERFNTEAKYTIDDYKRKGELWMLKSARNEAMCRQMSRDIAKARKRAEENLLARFGTVWVRNREERMLNEGLRSRIDALNKDHEQYMQSIVREARRQFESLVATNEDRENAQRERLQQLERTMTHAQQQFDKAEQLVAALKFTLTRGVEDHAKRERDKAELWNRRYAQMEQVYDDQLAEMKRRQQRERDIFQERISQNRRRSLAQHAAEMEELNIKLNQLEVDGHRRVVEVEQEGRAQTEASMSAIDKQQREASQSLERRFTEDESNLLQHIHEMHSAVADRRHKLESFCHFATQVEDLAHQVEVVLRGMPQPVALDAQVWRRQLATFQDVYVLSHFDLPRMMATLRRPIQLVVPPANVL